MCGVRWKEGVENYVGGGQGGGNRNYLSKGVWMEVYGRGYFFFQAEDGIRDLVRSRGLGDVYKRQARQ